MTLYTVQWREPGYGNNDWVIERNLFQDEQRALNIAYNMAYNRWNIDTFSKNDIREYSSGIVLFSKNKIIAEYIIVEFYFNDL